MPKSSPYAHSWTRGEVKSLAKDLGVEVDGNALVVVGSEVVQIRIKESSYKPADVIALLNSVGVNNSTEIKKAMRDAMLDDTRVLPCWMNSSVATAVMKKAGWRVASRSSSSGSKLLAFVKSTSSSKADKIVRVSSKDLDRKDAERLKRSLNVTSVGFNRLIFNLYPKGTAGVAWE